MIPQRILERFLLTFPEYSDKVKSYKEVWKDAIKLKMSDGSVLYFAWRPEASSEGWILSTSKESICH